MEGWSGKKPLIELQRCKEYIELARHHEETGKKAIFNKRWKNIKWNGEAKKSKSKILNEKETENTNKENTHAVQCTLTPTITLWVSSNVQCCGILALRMAFYVTVIAVDSLYCFVSLSFGRRFSSNLPSDYLGVCRRAHRWRSAMNSMAWIVSRSE